MTCLRGLFHLLKLLNKVNEVLTSVLLLPRAEFLVILAKQSLQHLGSDPILVILIRLLFSIVCGVFVRQDLLAVGARVESDRQLGHLTIETSGGPFLT